MSIDKKNVLDLLYIAKAGLAQKANDENVINGQLPQAEVSGRNLAAGRSTAYEKATAVVDTIIRDIIKMPEL